MYDYFVDSEKTIKYDFYYNKIFLLVTDILISRD